MRRLDGALRDRVRHEEEIKLAVDDLGLLDEALVNVGSLGRVVDEGRTGVSLSLLEESLANSLVHDDQGDLGLLNLDRSLALLERRLVFRVETVFFLYDLVELVELVVDDLLAHGITYTIPVDEDVLGHLAIEVAVALEGALEVV